MKLFGHLFGLGHAKSNSAPRIGPDELNRRLARDEHIAIVDVREPDEFAGPLGHIAASRNVPFSILQTMLHEFAALAQTPIVLVCRTDKRSAKAATILREAGCSDVAVLQGGMERWNGGGFSAGTGAENGQVAR